MSLMLRNAEHFGGNAEFQLDMFETIDNSVSRMRTILDRLGAEGTGSEAKDDDGETGVISLKALVANMSEEVSKRGLDLEMDLKGPEVSVAADEQSMISVVDHLLQNAIDAVGEHGKISIRLRVVDDEAILEIEDNGPGMDAEFVKTELFRPLDSSKENGYGIGAYQARQLVREMGGRLLVHSIPTKGTIMQVIVPVLVSLPEESDDRIAAV
jgi:signal transduction histidine kinase